MPTETVFNRIFDCLGIYQLNLLHIFELRIYFLLQCIQLFFILISSYIFSHHIILDTKSTAPPTKPSFTWEFLDAAYNKTNITWLPDMDGNPGSSFRVVYRLKGHTGWIETETVINSKSAIIDDLLSDTVYEMAVVSIDGKYTTESDVQEIKTIVPGKQQYFENKIEFYSINFLFLTFQRKNRIPLQLL